MTIRQPPYGRDGERIPRFSAQAPSATARGHGTSHSVRSPPTTSGTPCAWQGRRLSNRRSGTVHKRPRTGSSKLPRKPYPRDEIVLKLKALEQPLRRVPPTRWPRTLAMSLREGNGRSSQTSTPGGETIVTSKPASWKARATLANVYTLGPAGLGPVVVQDSVLRQACPCAPGSLMERCLDTFHVPVPRVCALDKAPSGCAHFRS